jgi:hypothetical protein
MGQRIRKFEGPGPRPDGLGPRKQDAQARQVYWDNLTRHEKIAALDTRLGVGLGAKKQRAKLAKPLEGKKG